MPDLTALLDRPAAERAREHRYRFGQALVFGTPVVALAYAGHHLGGPESAYWVGAFQALLAGWVTYVAVVGLLVEGFLHLGLRRLPTADLPVALLAAALYALSFVSWLHLLARGQYWLVLPMFHFGVVLVIAWTGLRWAWLGRRPGRA